MQKNLVCDFSPETREKIESAICTILDGTCQRVDINPEGKVYGVKNVIRIDLKVKDVTDG